MKKVDKLTKEKRARAPHRSGLFRTYRSAAALFWLYSLFRTETASDKHRLYSDPLQMLLLYPEQRKC